MAGTEEGTKTWKDLSTWEKNVFLYPVEKNPNLAKGGEQLRESFKERALAVLVQLDKGSQQFALGQLDLAMKDLDRLAFLFDRKDQVYAVQRELRAQFGLEAITEMKGVRSISEKLRAAGFIVQFGEIEGTDGGKSTIATVMAKLINPIPLRKSWKKFALNVLLEWLITTNKDGTLTAKPTVTSEQDLDLDLQRLVYKNYTPAGLLEALTKAKATLDIDRKPHE